MTGSLGQQRHGRGGGGGGGKKKNSPSLVLAPPPYLHGRHADVRRLPREQLPGDDAEAEHLRVGAAQKRHRPVQQDSVQGIIGFMDYRV